MTNWPFHYPDPELLRREIAGMVQALAGATREVFGDAHVRAVWFKGSAQKRWDSPMDYVPSLSDVDVHIWLSDEVAPRFLELETALQVQERTEALFADRCPDATHVPRPQLNLINELKKSDDYIPSPAGIVDTIFGAEPAPGDYADAERIRAQDRAALIENAKEIHVVPKRAIDRPGVYQWDLLRALSWRISPIGSRVLNLAGEAPEAAWSMNRTSIAAALRDRGLGDLVDPWERFYLENWSYYLSDRGDGAAGRRALRAASEVLARSGDYARNSTL